MTKIVVSLNLAEELLERAVAEKGADYEYPGWQRGCAYEREGAPSCIVGYALSYLGLDEDQLGKLDEVDYHFTDENGGHYGDSGIGVIAPLIAREYGVELTQPVIDFFEVAQTSQDSGVPWGLAVERAKDAVAAYNV